MQFCRPEMAPPRQPPQSLIKRYTVLAKRRTRPLIRHFPDRLGNRHRRLSGCIRSRRAASKAWSGSPPGRSRRCHSGQTPASPVIARSAASKQAPAHWAGDCSYVPRQPLDASFLVSGRCHPGETMQQMIVQGRGRSAETSVIHLSCACLTASPLFVWGCPGLRSGVGRGFDRPLSNRRGFPCLAPRPHPRTICLASLAGGQRTGRLRRYVVSISLPPTARAMAQMKAASSRATAVIATTSSLPARHSAR